MKVKRFHYKLYNNKQIRFELRKLIPVEDKIKYKNLFVVKTVTNIEIHIDESSCLKFLIYDLVWIIIILLFINN